MLNKRRDVENGVRALLREAGLKVGTPSRRDFSIVPHTVGRSDAPGRVGRPCHTTSGGRATGGSSLSGWRWFPASCSEPAARPHSSFCSSSKAPTSRMTGCLIGENANDVAAAFDFAVQPFEWVGCCAAWPGAGLGSPCRPARRPLPRPSGRQVWKAVAEPGQQPGAIVCGRQRHRPRRRRCRSRRRRCGAASCPHRPSHCA